METVNRYLFEALLRHSSRPMQVARGTTWTYSDVAKCVHGVAQWLTQKGIGPGDRVAMIAENSPQWMHAYLGILAVGGVIVPRGEDTARSDLEYILEHSEVKLVFAGTKNAAAALPDHYDVTCLDSDKFPGPVEVDEETVRGYAAAVKEKDIAVILYTSGTTGKPKGVVLEHRNLGHQLRVLPPLVHIEAGDVWVSILPPWHTFEQTVELAAFHSGSVTVYSDKRRIRDDLREHQPHFFASVPRIWESVKAGALSAIEKKSPLIAKLFAFSYAGSRAMRRGNPFGIFGHMLGKTLFYKKVAAATGGRLKCAISGGGYLPGHVDEFFDIVGVKLIIGYGLTETAPVIAIRLPEDNVLGTIGRAVPETEFRIAPEGTVQVRGPQIMRGYYKDDELTKSVLDDDGWFDTGDLVRISDKGDLTFVGRAKETIVLSGGENVEPEPIENRIKESALIDQVMLVGQDQKNLGALVVVAAEDAPTGDELTAAVRDILRAGTGAAAGLRPIEAVNRFHIVAEPFSTENGLMTQTLKLKRNVIADQYAAEIAALYT
ncbi:MAG: long-chain fatty acid--CoA ligase [Planctomycetota bacterium]